jgi:hypothetical protein
MVDSQEKYTLDEAQKVFARQSNGKVWNLLDKTDRTAEENDEMIEAAYASLYHWRVVGTEVNLQRGEWMLAHVYTVLGKPKAAIKHANLCITLTGAHRDQMKDFDIAYAFEGMARALALNGTTEEARRYLAQAQTAGEAIAEAEDKQIFLGDLNSGDWYGVK